MARKTASKKSRIGGCTFGQSFIPVFTLIFLSLYILSLTGCNEEQASVTQANRARKIPPDARKVAVLKELDRKFENPQAHFELLAENY